MIILLLEQDVRSAQHDKRHTQIYPVRHQRVGTQEHETHAHQ